MEQQLLIAVQQGNLHWVKYFVEHGRVDLHKMSPAILLTADDKLEIIVYLIENGADIYASNSIFFETICRKNYLRLIKHFTENKSLNLNFALITVSNFATNNGTHLETIKYLVEHGANIHACMEKSLIYACMYGNYEIVKYLVENGADIHVQHEWPLERASFSFSKDRLKIVEFLVENGADIHARDDLVAQVCKFKRYDVASYLIRKGGIINGPVDILWDANHTELENVKFIVEHNGAIRNIEKKKYSRVRRYIKFLDKIKNRRAILIQKWWKKNLASKYICKN